MMMPATWGEAASSNFGDAGEIARASTTFSPAALGRVATCAVTSQPTVTDPSTGDANRNGGEVGFGGRVQPGAGSEGAEVPPASAAVRRSKYREFTASPANVCGGTAGSTVTTAPAPSSAVSR